MIHFLTSARHVHTHQALLEKTDLPVRVLRYNEALAEKDFSPPVCVFTDIDRLHVDMLHRSAALYGRLKKEGRRVLNDPARVLSRYGLLRRLHERGDNRFNAYLVEECRQPQAWPVFLREKSGHGGVLSDLLHDPAELTRAIRIAIERGTPVCNLMFVEYAAEPLPGGIFRKLSTFRVGDRWLAYTCVHDTQWCAKAGVKGIATPELYEDEYRIVRDNPWLEQVRPAFEAARIDYGRVDFGIVDGRVQVYEINTNPDLKFSSDHPSPVRVRTYHLFRENFVTALRALLEG